MTVIVSDGLTIAADGLEILGHSEIARRNARKIAIADGAVYALAGVGGVFETLIQWHKNGADPAGLPPLRDNKNWTLLVIDGNGPATYCSDMPYRQELEYPVTVGCGADYAMGCLLAGATPQRAVELVCTKDAFCGGEIQVVNIAEALGLAPEPKVVQFSKRAE